MRVFASSGCAHAKAAAGIAPQLAVTIFRGVQSGEHRAALEAQQQLSLLAERISVPYGVGGVKAALDMCGCHGGAVRGPLRQPGAEALEEIRQTLVELKLINHGRAKESSSEREEPLS